jgi:hypothetical protein
LIVDTCVARNFAILHWGEELAVLSGGAIRVVHGVLGTGALDPSELSDVRGALNREAEEMAGTPAGSRATSATVGLDRLASMRGSALDVIMPSEDEFAVAVRLQDPAERAWLRSLGVTRARRLGAGEAVSIAVAVSRGLALGTDDDAARQAYEGLGGVAHMWTLDLAKKAVEIGLLAEGVAQQGYDELLRHYRFHGIPWT